MPTYEVIVLGVQGINNKVHGPGAKVTDAHFPEGNAEKLVKEGKLRRITNPKEDAKESKESKAKKLKALQAEVDKAKETLELAEKALENVSENATEQEKIDLKKTIEEAQLAFDIANENFEKA